MRYLRYPLSLRNVEDLWPSAGSTSATRPSRLWWNRFGPIFAAEIRKRRVARMRGYPQWRWHLDEAFVKVNGKLCYLWRAVDHEGEVLEAVAHREARQSCGTETSQADHEEIRGSSQHRHRWASGISGGDERDRCCCRAARGRRSAQQSSGEFASAVSATRTGDAALSKSEDAAEI